MEKSIKVKNCSKCGVEKTVDRFTIHRYGNIGYSSWCRDCSNGYRREHKKANKKYWQQVYKEAKIKLRTEIFSYYGGRCTCCGESTYEFLSLDHVHGGGHAERKLLKGTETIMRKIRRGELPKDNYTVLCHNCNQAKGHYGVCPHQGGKFAAEGKVYRG